ncbi:MAG: ABC transporter permease subunit [Candidatus Sumerlaeaceae bacterium]
MPIYDQTFRRYDGPRRTRALWWPIARTTFRPVLKSKLTWLLLLGVFVYLVFISIGFFAASKIQELAPGQAEEAARAARMQKLPIFGKDMDLGTVFYFFITPLFPAMGLLLLATGGGSISTDLRNSALPLYFSRPLKPWHYVFGKILGMAILPFGALTAGLLIIFVQFIAYFKGAPGLLSEFPVLLSALLQVGIVSFLLSIAITGFSSTTKNARTAGILYFGFFIATTALGEILVDAAHMRELRAIAPRFALDTVARVLLKPDFAQIRSSVDVTGVRFQFAACALVAYAVFFLVLLRRNLRVVEVVK